MHQNNADLIRPGCRGGHDQFNWESLRTMKYHDREQYLGQTTVIGYLDKGGKWRKKDWYAKKDERSYDEMKIQEDLRRVKEDDERRLRIALGIEQPDDGKTQQVKLTKEEIAQLTKKSKPDIDEENEQKGLGSGPLQKKVVHHQAPSKNLLEAYGVQDEYKVKQESSSRSSENVERTEKKIKKDKKSKRDKKEKKEKRDKRDKKDKKNKH